MAAEQGNAQAQLFVGVMSQDASESAKWTRLAADQGNAEAQLFLGTLYDSGSGVPQDDAEAVKWIRLAAKRKRCLRAVGISA